MLLRPDQLELARKALYCRIPPDFQEAEILDHFSMDPPYPKIVWINNQSCLIFVDRPQDWVGDRATHYGPMHVKRFVKEGSKECRIREIPTSFWSRWDEEMEALDSKPVVDEKLTDEQIAYWRRVLDDTNVRYPDCNPPLTVIHDRVTVLSDHKLFGGTKYRALVPLMVGLDTFNEFVYAGPVYGYAQLALSRAAKTTGKTATLFLDKVRPRHPLTELAIGLGAKVIETDNGYLALIQALAQKYVAESPTTRYGVPFGVHCPEFLWLLTEQLRRVIDQKQLDVTTVWCAAGSGTIMQVLHELWPNATFMIIQVGKYIKAETVEGIKHRIIKAPESFPEVARNPPPFPSASNYDAKVWQFITQPKYNVRPTDIFWNVGGEGRPR